MKPANVLLSAEGSPKLADFNISFNSQIEGATPAAYFGGSLAYMSPEQLEACNPSHDRKPEDLAGTSDIFSLAVVLWELLHGERPFSDEELNGAWSVMLVEMAGRRRTAKPRPPVHSSDPIASRLEQVLQVALSPDPAQRHPDGASLARELLLCLSPRAWDLTHNMTTGWRSVATREPMASLITIVLPPFLFAGWFNLWYNQNYYVPDQLGGVETKAFSDLILPINLVLYPLGIGLGWAYLSPATSALRRLRGGATLNSAELRRARRRTVTLGDGIAIVGISLWLAAGLAFPAGIHLIAGKFPWQGYLHFVLAMVVCGIISCCLPFLLATWLSIRVFFPALLVKDSPDADEQRRLQALSRRSTWYLLLSSVTPLLALVLLVVSGADNVWATLALIGISVGGLGGAYFIWQRIRADLSALTIATRSVELSTSATDTVEVF